MNPEGRRGLTLDSVVSFNKSRIPTSIDLTGDDAEGRPVVEHFALSRGRAEWTNSLGPGGTTFQGNAYYLTIPVVEQQISGLPAEICWLARALLVAPGRRLTLLPWGEATLRKIQAISVRHGPEHRNVTEYEIRGLDFSPVPVWLDDNGEPFAVTGVEWVATIREGWESSLPHLRAAQQEAESTRALTLARQLAQHPRGPVVFRHAAVFDAESAEVRPEMTVIVSGKRIQAVGKDGSVAIPRGARTIDCRGMTLLPGLWDLHTHLNPNDGLLHLAAGVTAVRDMGNYIRRVMELRLEFDQGTRIGPRVWLAGLVDGRGPYQAPTEVLVDTEQEARDAVDWFSRLGYVQMKVYGTLKPELVPLLARLAHEHHMRISGHIPAHMTASRAVEQGLDEINHTNYLFLNFMPQVTETQTDLRITEPAEHAAELDLHSSAVTAFFDFLKQHHTVVDPTLNTYETRYTARKGSVDPAFASVEAELPYRWRRNARMGGIPVPEGKDERYRASFQAFLNIIGELHRHGIATIVGSDGFPGLGYARELELDVRAGIPANEVLRIATIDSARLLEQDADLGSIASGKLADLVLVRGDPTRNISDIRRTYLVMRGGVLYSGAALRAACGLAPPEAEAVQVTQP